MEALIYFTKAVVTLGDLEALADEFGYVHGRLDPVSAGGEPWLSITWAPDSWWQWFAYPTDEEGLAELDPGERAIVTAYAPASAYVIMHHANSWLALRAFLLRLLDRYDGWIGGSDDDFAPILTRGNIATAVYPVYPEWPDGLPPEPQERGRGRDGATP